MTDHVHWYDEQNTTYSTDCPPSPFKQVTFRVINVDARQDSITKCVENALYDARELNVRGS